MTGRWPLAVCAMAMLSLTGARVQAHEIGTTRVTLSMTAEDRYECEVVTDAVALLEKLEAVSGGTSAPVTDPEALRLRLEALEAVFASRVAVSFSGRPVLSDIAWTVTPATTINGSPLALIRLSGTVPEGARYVQWKYSWTFASYALVAEQNGAESTQWIEGAATSPALPLETIGHQVSRKRLAAQYLVLGFQHIVPRGIDHVLFVLGIFLVSRRARPILLQVSAFTVAHSITLALGMYGVLTLPSSIVEPAIALSIAYLAVENVFMNEPRRWRYALVFVFGLLHGLGFAGALNEIGLPRAEFLTALVSFNAGVEIGQLAVIACAYAVVGYWFGRRTWYRRRIVVPASACIACLGIYWMFERLRVIS